jgi:hypothetical protein
MVPILNPTYSVYATILLFHLCLFLSSFPNRILYAYIFPGMLVTGSESRKHSKGKLNVYHKLGFCSTLLQECKTALILEEELLFSYTLLTSQTEVVLLQNSDFKKGEA